ncbi:alpha/beta hydrolase domain-containing protein [Bradyrhizobium sp.]
MTAIKIVAVRALATTAVLMALAPAASQARIVRVEVTQTAPAWGGRNFGEIGAYERVIGKAYGEIDPQSPSNAMIQDIGLAPKNARGMVEYSTDIDILRPADRTKSNGVLFFNIINRGNKGGLALFNADIPGGPANIGNMNAVTEPGDGFMQQQGYTVVWFGWQPDVVSGNSRMMMQVPVAKNPDGSEITGTVRNELTVLRPVTTLPVQSGWFTAGSRPYPTVSTDNKTALADGFLPTLSVRVRENEPRTIIANTEWSFGSCEADKAPAVNDWQICYPAGFKPGRLYELTYRAKDPLVLGLGFAAARDLGAFLKASEKDDSGAANPAYVANAKAIVMGSSQSGRFIRTLIHLGFNKDEAGKIVFEGALPHIGGGLMPLNVRFGQPGRATTNTTDHLFPGAEFPFAYAKVADPLTGRTQGILDRCTETGTCPRIVHAATALEMWELRQSLGFTDPLGTRDLDEPANVRSYIMASTQHAPAVLPLPAKEPLGFCQQQPNPNPHTWTMRALLTHLVAWVKDGAEPPPSSRPTIAAGNLVAPDQVRFPRIPANAYGGVTRPAVKFVADNDPLHVQDYGKDYNAGDASGIISGDPPKLSTARYGTLVAQVDADGNDLGGIRNVFAAVPIGTYTGWNYFNKEFFEDGFCTLSGSFIPFAPTKQERLATADPRPSIEERYPRKASYVAAFKKAADDLVAQRFLLPDDAIRLVSEAERDGIRSAP